MKIHSECIPCLFERAKFECDLAFGNDERGKIKALAEVAKFAAEKINENTVPALIGTERGRIITDVSGVVDPYEELKRESNKAGREILPLALRFYKESDDKLISLMKLAAAANSMEYGVRGHSFDEKRFASEFSEILKENVAGDIQTAKEAIQRFSKILYLLDNAGEVIIDKFVIDELVAMGKKVIASPKSKPVINDVTAGELIELGFKHENIVSSGAFVGVSLEEAPEEFLKLLFDPEYLIVAKGMGNYETLSEFEDRLRGRLVYIFRAKCLSVAESARVVKGTLVITTV
jgi:uncharacterized protein with ATP-grasp and redox domains